MNSNGEAWSVAFDRQKRIIRELFSLVSELSKRVAAIEKGQVVDLKELEKALGIPESDRGEDEEK